MTTHSVLAALPMVAVAGVLFLLSSRIRAGDLHLIAGYEPNRVNDKAGVSRLFGRVLTGLAMAGLATAVIQAARPALGYEAMLGFGGIGIVAIIIVFIGRGRYIVAPSRPPASGSKAAPLPPNDR